MDLYEFLCSLAIGNIYSYLKPTKGRLPSSFSSVKELGGVMQEQGRREQGEGGGVRPPSPMEK